MGKLYTAIIETPKGAFIKRDEKGSIDLISPIPCPFNYGRVKGLRGKDGDPLDAVVLGPGLQYNAFCVMPVVGRVLFVDAGLEDHKIVFSKRTPTKKELLSLRLFFGFYAQIKKLSNFSFKSRCRTEFLGLECGEIDLYEFMHNK